MLTTELAAPLLPPPKRHRREVTPLLFDAHTKLMEKLPPELTGSYKPVIRMFLVYLEGQGKSFADLRGSTQSAAPSMRPEALENEVNMAIAQGYVVKATPHALNAGFALRLNGLTTHTIQLNQSEHKAQLLSLKFNGLPEKRYVLRFFSYLEEKKLRLSQLQRSKQVSPDPKKLLTVGDALEHAVQDKKFPREKCYLVYRALGMTKSKKEVHTEDHKALLQALPDTLSRDYQSTIRRFFVTLESAGLTYAQLRGPATAGPQFTKRPQALQDHVNEGTAEKKYTPSLRPALNAGFGLDLVGPSAREQWPNW
jgi:hypothetical protein